jgi:hypothetical protein
MMLATPIEDVLFRSVETALYFAFSEQYIDLPQSPASRMASTPSRSGNGLGGLDGFAQAGMILCSMGDLGELHRHILTARFSPAVGECRCGSACCRGFRHNLRWLTAVSAISDFVGQEVPSTMAHRRLREGIVRKHFGDKVRLGEVADVCGVHRNTASNHASKILSILKSEEKSARFEIRAVLESSGVVGN